MKSLVLSSVVAALLVFSGCSTKDPEATGSNSAANNAGGQEVKAVNTESVDPQNSVISSGSDTLDNSMSGIEKRLGSVYFEFDKFTVTADMQNTISSQSKLINEAAAKYTIKLEGNCDEWGSDEYNFALGLKRSEAIKKALIAQGVSADKITLVSYGESNPSCTEKTQECWAKNRRVDFKLLP
jgi:peptidoglycan-associated lipoprotein